MGTSVVCVCESEHPWQEYVSERRCLQALSLRGLLRIWCSLHMPSVLHFLTLHGFVNQGFLNHAPRPLPFLHSDRKASKTAVVIAQ